MKRLRQRFREASLPLAHHLKFIDECGAHVGMTRFFGRAAPGKRVVEATAGYSGTHYSRDLNPIELCWSKVKAALRSAKARTFDALVDALCDALCVVNLTDVLAWFAHYGYTVNP